MKVSSTRMVRIFYLASIYTISTFLWRFLVPAHEESEGNFLIDMEVVLEFITVPGLVGLFVHLRSHHDDVSKVALTITFWIALLASIGILVMRLSTTDGWYTGHRVFQPG